MRHIESLIVPIILCQSRSIRIFQIDIVGFACKLVIQYFIGLVYLSRLCICYWKSSVVSSSLTLSGWNYKASFRYAFLMSCLEAVLCRTKCTRSLPELRSNSYSRNRVLLLLPIKAQQRIDGTRSKEPSTL